jgi:hypothetical protein
LAISSCDKIHAVANGAGNVVSVPIPRKLPPGSYALTHHNGVHDASASSNSLSLGPTGMAMLRIFCSMSSGVWLHEPFSQQLANLRSSFALTGCALRIPTSHVADDGLPAFVHMNMLNADKLLPAVTQPSKNLYLGCISPH